MDDSVEARIIDLHLRQHSQNEIVTALHLSKMRVSRAFKHFPETGQVPNALRVGRPSKVTSELASDIEGRTLQEPAISGVAFSAEISEQFHVSLSRTAVNVTRAGQFFKYQPTRHDQALTAAHIEDRITFCHKMLRLRDDIPLIHYSDESRFILGDDRRWIWYQRGQENPPASISLTKFPPSVMVFAVIGMGDKSDLLIIEGSIDSDRYVQNLEALGFIEDLDRRYGPMSWIFQQDGVSRSDRYRVKKCQV
jgi:transposase